MFYALVTKFYVVIAAESVAYKILALHCVVVMLAWRVAYT